MDLQEDLENPYDCMARYELRLGKRGIKTVLGMVPMKQGKCFQSRHALRARTGRDHAVGGYEKGRREALSEQ
jgi:hypothetical protein